MEEIERSLKWLQGWLEKVFSEEKVQTNAIYKGDWDRETWLRILKRLEAPEVRDQAHEADRCSYEMAVQFLREQIPG